MEKTLLSWSQTLCGRALGAYKFLCLPKMATSKCLWMVDALADTADFTGDKSSRSHAQFKRVDKNEICLLAFRIA